MKRSARLVLGLLGMTIVPILLVTGYLLVTRGRRPPLTEADGLALAAALIVGLAFLAWLPLKSRLRWGIGVVYVPLAAFSLFNFAALFVCARYSACF